MSKIKVAVLFGGASSEYEISLVSAVSVLKNINSKQYEVLKIGITKDGNFFLYEGSIEKIENNTWLDETTKLITFSCNKKDHGFYREFLKIKVTIYGVITRLHFFNFSFLEIC